MNFNKNEKVGLDLLLTILPMLPDCYQKFKDLEKENDMLRQEIERLKLDHLTEMNTRTQFERDRYIYEREVSNGYPKVVYMIDINYLHAINRLKGYHAGDSLIKKISFYIMELVRSTSNTSAYRIGGDEFIVIGNLENKQILDKLLYTPNSTVSSRIWNEGTLDKIMKQLDNEIIKVKKSRNKRNRDMNSIQLKIAQNYNKLKILIRRVLKLR